MSASLRFFLWSLPPIGITYFIIAVLLELAFGEEFIVIDPLISSIFFALFFGGIMNLIHHRAVRSKLNRTPSYEDLKSIQEERIQLNVKLDKLFKILSKQPLKRAKAPQLENGIIKIKTTPSDSSWGEIIEIEASNESDQRFTIRSRPKVKLNFFDFGKATENLIQLKAHLKQLKVIIPE